MHEIGITKDLVDLVQQKIQEEPLAKQVTAVYVSLGKGLGISEESLAFWFSHFGANTKLADSKLQVSIVEGNILKLDSLEYE